jgi:ESF2/ABP1 family protein
MLEKEMIETQQDKKVIDFEDLKQFKQEKDETGVIYLSRVPPFMLPHEVRSHFISFGPIGRLYLTPLSKNSSRRPLFVDGWVEFLKKRDAKTAVLALHGNLIGGKKRGRFHDDLWSLKYLSGFKWSDLTEKISYENAVKEEKIKNERAQARRETQFYLKQAEKAKVLKKISAKKNKGSENLPSIKDSFETLKKNFRQRKPINVE